MGEQMKVVEIKYGIVHRIYPEFSSVEDTRDKFASNIHFESAPDDTFEGWIFHPEISGEGRFQRPALPDGFAWDDTGAVPIAYDVEARRYGERVALHESTTNDTLEAYRKLRQGDKTIDWQAWLDTLDVYNVAIEETKNQEGYPLKVEYPEYPTKPTA